MMPWCFTVPMSPATPAMMYTSLLPNRAESPRSFSIAAQGPWFRSEACGTMLEKRNVVALSIDPESRRVAGARVVGRGKVREGGGQVRIEGETLAPVLCAEVRRIEIVAHPVGRAPMAIVGCGVQ